MPRLARFIETNSFYHIISRSINEARILRDDDDFCHFLQFTLQAKRKYPIRIFHYVIMNTHFHFAVQAPTHKILSQNLSYVKWHYTLWVRRKYGWRGHLWRERYKSLPIENEDYLSACGMYIEFNPVRAGICTKLKDYPYSSYRKYHLKLTDSLVDDYETGDWINQSATVDYQSRSAKNLFSHTPAIGSTAFINKCKNLKDEYKMSVPKSDCH